MVERGEAVRTSVMRGTTHLVSATDALVLRAVMDPVMRATFRSSSHAKALAGTDVEAIAGEALKLLSAAPLSRAELSRALAER